jgi:hemolysin D
MSLVENAGQATQGPEVSRALVAPCAMARVHQAACDTATQSLLQLLSKEKLLAQVIRRLEGDLSTKDQLQAQLQAEWQDISAKLSKADFTKLVDQGFISSHATQDKTQERVELERDLVTQRARLSEAIATAAETEQAKSAYKAETQRQLADRYAQASTKRIQLSADQRQKQTQLRAPVSGVIQQLAIHSVGGVVTSAQALMVVVPDSNQVTAEVSIANQDIGFVNGGQGAEIKLETLSFTKYGTIKATVDNVSADTVTDEKRGSFYPAILTLEKKGKLIDGKSIPISPGMNITAEIKTGKRRIIEFLLSPVQRAGSESLRAIVKDSASKNNFFGETRR